MRTIGFVASALVASAALAAFPGGNGKIAFVSSRDGNYEIYAMNSDGGEPTNLTRHAADDLDPAWSPDGARIAFASGRGGSFAIWVMGADGAGARLLAGGLASARFPAWSPDGSRLAFSAQPTAAEDSEIYVVGTDGTGLVRLTTDAWEDSEPAWSPDGARLAYASMRSAAFTNDVIVMRADGSAAANLNSDAFDDSSPDWSPDGARIVFSSTRSGLSALWTMSADGSGKSQLTSAPEGDVTPVFSPDGAKIAFASFRNLDFDVYVMDADGTDLERLTTPPAGEALAPFDYYPDWQRVEPAAEGHPPVADAGPDQTVACAGPEGALVALDGSASTDSDSTPGTNDDIVAFAWRLEDGTPLGSGETLEVTLPLGRHLVTLLVTDRAGATAEDEVVVTVSDTAAPAIRVQVTPDLLWPPDHRMVPVRARVLVSDACGTPTFTLVSVTSSEPDDAQGDGNAAPDVAGAELGTPDTEFSVRAERSALGAGRTYTVTYVATDAAGNATEGRAVILVPKSASDGSRHGPGDPPTPPASRAGAKTGPGTRSRGGR